MCTLVTEAITKKRQQIAKPVYPGEEQGSPFLKEKKEIKPKY